MFVFNCSQIIVSQFSLSKLTLLDAGKEIYNGNLCKIFSFLSHRDNTDAPYYGSNSSELGKLPQKTWVQTALVVVILNRDCQH